MLGSCDNLQSFHQEEIDLSSDEELIIFGCYVCLEQRVGNFALLHGTFVHAGFCKNCATN